MAWTETCKLDFNKQIEHKKAQGVSVKESLNVLSKESGIPVGTLKRWVYPDGQKTYEKKRPKRKSIKTDTSPKSDVAWFTADLKGFNEWLKRTGECLTIAHRIIRGKVPQKTSKEKKVVISCFKLINAFYKKHKGEKLFKNEK